MWINITDDSEPNKFEAEFEIFDYCGEFKFFLWSDGSVHIYDVVASTAEGPHYMTKEQMEGLEYWLNELLIEQRITYSDYDHEAYWHEHKLMAHELI